MNQTSNDWYNYFCQQLQDLADKLEENRHLLKQSEVEDILQRAAKINRLLELIARDFK